MRRLVEDMTSGKDATEIGHLVRQLMSAGPVAGIAAIQSAAHPHRRRPRREDEVTYRVRIDLKGLNPPIWRRVELRSEMFLDEVHQVIQVALGWTDSHLHRFALGRSVWDRDAELYLCPFDVDEGEDDGIAEEEVRLDEVLVEVGDKLLYAYDYGDGWDHVVRLEAILERRAEASRAVCTGGRRAGPPEDCGGVWGYQELVDSGAVDAEEFDVDDINEALFIEAEIAETVARLSEPLVALLARVKGYPVENELAELLREARLGEPVLINAVDAVEMVRRYAWLLERVGDDGIKLTSAGYLPPADVAAAVSELEMADEWYGNFNREVQTLPVLELRESAQKMGLLRKHLGHLLLTREAKKLRGDPIGLWWHIARRLPLHRSELIEQHAGVVSLLGAAAGGDIGTENFKVLLSDVLTAVGWRTASGEPVGPWNAAFAAGETVQVLGHMGAFAGGRRPLKREEATPVGAAFARAALQRQP